MNFLSPRFSEQCRSCSKIVSMGVFLVNNHKGLHYVDLVLIFNLKVCISILFQILFEVQYSVLQLVVFAIVCQYPTPQVAFKNIYI